MTINQMIYIVTLAKCKNFSEAAKVLYITQPALSRQISLIEAEISTKIFYRNNKSTKLTKAGEKLYEGIEAILQQYNTLISEVQNIGSTSSSKLRIGLVEMRPPLPIITDTVNRLILECVKVDVLVKGMVELQECLINDDLDIIITHDDTLVSSVSKYKQIVLSTVQNCLVVPATHKNADLEQVSLIDFKDEEFFMIDQETKNYERNFQISCKLAGFTPKIHYVDGMSDLVALASVGTIITCFPADHYLRFLPNVRFLSIPEITASETKAIWKKESSNKALKSFIDILYVLIGKNLQF